MAELFWTQLIHEQFPHGRYVARSGGFNRGESSCRRRNEGAATILGAQLLAHQTPLLHSTHVMGEPAALPSEFLGQN